MSTARIEKQNTPTAEPTKRRVDESMQPVRERGRATAGFVGGWTPVFVLLIVGIVALLVIPNFLSSHNASADANTKIARELMQRKPISPDTGQGKTKREVPPIVPDQTSINNSSAQSAGYNAKICQELEYQNTNIDSTGGRYADNLETLLAWDKLLTDDPMVTFTFGACNSSGYTFSTTHAQGDRSFDFID